MAESAAKQATFLWEGKDKKGNKVKGESSGTHLNIIKAELRRQGISPTKVRKKSSLGGPRKQKIRSQGHRHLLAPASHHDVGGRTPGAVLRDHRARP